MVDSVDYAAFAVFFDDFSDVVLAHEDGGRDEPSVFLFHFFGGEGLSVAVCVDVVEV